MVLKNSPIPRLLYETVSRGKKEWEQTFDAVPDLIFITDAHHTIIRANLAVSRRLGMRPEEIPGRKCHELLHCLPSPPDFCPYLKMMQDGRAPHPVEIEEKSLGAFLDISVSPLHNEAGELTGCVHVARDITERKRAEEVRLALEQQLLQAQKLESLGVLAGGIAHDFNNILMIILGHCLLAKDDPDPASSKRHLVQIEAAGNRAADLCRQMLNYAGKSPLVQTHIDMGTLVTDMVQMLRPAFGKDVRFECDLESGVAAIAGDEGKIQQVVMNLVVNAVEAVGENGGAVRVGLSSRIVTQGEQRDFFGNPVAAGAYACLEVADTGCGMDPQTQKRIFEPFFTTKFTGRGLGLSAIVGIIKAHDGALELFSKPGHGTTFKVLLPLAAAKRTEGEDATADGDAAHEPMQGTVLLVDDEEELRQVAAELLRAMGFTVLTASNGREALKLYRQRQSEIELVVMDLTMPEMDGLRTYQKLRDMAAALPVLFCSGFGNSDLSASIGHDAHAAFIPKPYRIDQIREALARLRPRRGKEG